MNRKLIIFDFDGTLADTLPVFVNVFDQAADKYGFQRMDRSRQHTLLVGDEIRDAKVSAEAGVDFGAVAWGFNTLDALMAENPSRVFRAARDLLEH